MPYFEPKPVGKRKPDEELSAGELGRLHHHNREHTKIAIPAKFHTPDNDIEFGITDEAILDLIQIMQKNQVTVVEGPTGSGKSTYLPYRLMVPPLSGENIPTDQRIPEDLFTRRGPIVITQPRIQATRGIPGFLARDLHGCTLGAGGDIGYVWSGENASDYHNKLIYCTDGTLINWIASGKIADFSVIIIDEAHERSINIDVILGLLVEYLPFYPDLRVIIASATINAPQFIEHFEQVSSVGFKSFEGHSFGYETFHQEKKVTGDPSHKDVMGDAVIETCLEITRLISKRGTLPPQGFQHKKEGSKAQNDIFTAVEGDILAFMPTVQGVERTVEKLRKKIAYDPILNDLGIDVLPLYSALPLEEQDKALQKKADAITQKIFQTLRKIETKQGDVIALVPDRKTAESVVSKSQHFMDTEDIQDVQIFLWNENDQPDHGKQSSGTKRVYVAEYRKVDEDTLDSFAFEVHDRRIVISTTVAETSLTVDGIVYVVDSGLIMQPDWNENLRAKKFPTKWHSQAGCKQRWGRSGRVRNGYAFCTYTRDQFDGFEGHTPPKIEREPLEQTVLTAKRAGIDNVKEFPWVEAPSLNELERAEHSLVVKDILDRDGDLTGRGEVVSRFHGEPDEGLLLSLADRFSCAVEMATFLALKKKRIHGGLLINNEKWDGYTRRSVRKIHDSLLFDCQDDFEIYLRIFQHWFEADQPHTYPLTDEPFKNLWPENVPVLPDAVQEHLDEKKLDQFLGKVKKAAQEQDLIALKSVIKGIPNAQQWFEDALAAFRNTRREAWSRRFFIDHHAMLDAEEKRGDILEPLAIAKRHEETRPIDFTKLIHKARMIMAYAWPERLYEYVGDSYRAVTDEMRDVERGSDVILGDQSALHARDEKPPLVLCLKRGAFGYRTIYLSTNIWVPPSWKNLHELPFIEFVRWYKEHEDQIEYLKPEQVFVNSAISQRYPLGGKAEYRREGEEDGGLVVQGVHQTPLLVYPTHEEGEIIWTGSSSVVVGEELDPEAQKVLHPEVHLQPDEPEALDAAVIDEDLEKDGEGIEAEKMPAVSNLEFPRLPAMLSEESELNNPVSQKGEILGYHSQSGDLPVVELRPVEDPPVFDQFLNRFEVGDTVRVKALEFEGDLEGDDPLSLVVKPVGFNMEVVMDAADLSFSGAYANVGEVELGTEFNAVLEKVDEEHQRVYFTCLPLLEAHMPEVGEWCMVQLLKDRQKTVQVKIAEKPEGLPVSGVIDITLGVDGPHSLKHTGESTYSVQIRPVQRFDMAVLGIQQEFIEYLEQKKWSGLIGWDENKNKLWVADRLNWEQRGELLGNASDPHLRYVIRKLYRISNMLNGRADFEDYLTKYEENVRPGTHVQGTVVKEASKTVFIKLAEGVIAQVRKSKLARHNNQHVDVGDKIDRLVFEGIDVNQGKALVETPVKKVLKEQYPVGSIQEGKVISVKLTEVIVALGDKHKGSVHKNEVSWCNISHPRVAVSKGERVRTRVLGVRSDGNIDLSMRLEENDPLKKYPPGSEVKGKVSSVRHDGAVVIWGRGEKGKIQVEELSWGYVERVDKILDEGDVVKVMIIKTFGRPRKMRLSLRKTGRDYLEFSIPENKIGTLYGRKHETQDRIQKETGIGIELVNQEGDVRLWYTEKDQAREAHTKIKKIIPEMELKN